MKHCKCCDNYEGIFCSICNKEIPKRLNRCPCRTKEQIAKEKKETKSVREKLLKFLKRNNFTKNKFGYEYNKINITDEALTWTAIEEIRDRILLEYKRSEYLGEKKLEGDYKIILEDFIKTFKKYL